MPRSTLERSLRLLRKYDCEAASTEKWVEFRGAGKRKIQGHGHRVDLFGFVDIEALWPGNLHSGGGRLVGVQATTFGQMSQHRLKILQDAKLAARLRLWLKCGLLFELHGWRQRVEEGKAKPRWECVVESAVLVGGHPTFTKDGQVYTPWGSVLVQEAA